MKTVSVPANGMIRLPKRLFKPADRVTILSGAGILIIKKLDSPRLSSLAARVTEHPLALREVAREVRAYRRAKRAR